MSSNIPKNIKTEVDIINSESIVLHNEVNLDVLRKSLSKIKEGDLFEFGVFNGKSIKEMLTHTKDRKIYGFDSFLGLPEDWRKEFKRGAFSTNGKHPNIKDTRVSFVTGMFHKSLPKFLVNYTGKVALIHIDCDIYSSTRTVLRFMKRYITSGVVIVFDEFIRYDGFHLHEIKAWLEFVAENKIAYEYLYSSGEQTSLIIL